MVQGWRRWTISSPAASEAGLPTTIDIIPVKRGSGKEGVNPLALAEARSW
jgi:hypothetical protein